MRVLVGQLHDIIAIGSDPLAATRLDHDRPVGTIGFLKARVAMKPVSARLFDREPVGEGFTRSNTAKADAGDAVLVEGQNQSVPMNRGGLAEVVGHIDGDFLALLES